MMKTGCIIILWALGTLFSCTELPVDSSLPSVEKIDRYSCTLSWKTGKPVKDRVEWNAEGEGVQSLSEGSPLTEHQFHLTGLLPEKVYYYRMGNSPGREFSFRTVPSGTPSFRFCIISRPGTEPEKVEQVLPDFILLSEMPQKDEREIRNSLAHINTRVPVISAPFSFDWGPFLFRNLEGPGGSGVLLLPGEQKGTGENGGKVPEGEVLFRAEGDSLFQKTEDGRIIFNTAGNPLLVEVQAEDIRAGIIGTEEGGSLPLLVRESAYSYQKTCVYCRRLLEGRQYEKSIAFYRKFIAQNGEQSLHDDAWYQIGYIYDHYLFNYPLAIEAYQRLLENYPESRHAHQAGFRTGYIRQHQDYEYKPLEVFERARLVQARESDSALDQVSAVLNAYPDCSLRDEILLWLGNGYAGKDPGKAMDYLGRLYSLSSDEEMKWKAGVLQGDIHYDAQEYRKAEKIYRSLQAAFPGKSSKVAVKIQRCGRNLIREVIRYLAWALLAFFATVAALQKPKWFGLDSLKPAGILTLMYAAAGTLPFLVYYDFLGSTVRLVGAMVPAMGGVMYIVFEMGRKSLLRGVSDGIRLLAASAAAVIMTASALYLLMYHFHYLFVFERLMK